MVMAQKLYTLLTPNVFHLPKDPGKTAVYVPAVLANQPVNTLPLMWTAQGTINTRFPCTKHYFMLMHNIKRVCFTALRPWCKREQCLQSVGWRVINILDHLSETHSQPTPARLALNVAAFCNPYLAADAPEVLFCWIEDCAKIALLRCDPYTYCQLIKNAIHLLLTSGLYLQPFEEWDHLLPTEKNLDCIAHDDTGVVPALSQHNGPNNGPSRICTHTAISAERIWGIGSKCPRLWQGLHGDSCNLGCGSHLPKPADRKHGSQHKQM